MSQEELLNRSLSLVAEERKVQLALIECLREVERRSLHLEMGFPSMWEFATRFLKLSEGAAQRRLAAMRLTSEVPEAKTALESGTLSLSNASRLQTFFRQEEKLGHDRTPVQKANLILEILNSPLVASVPPPARMDDSSTPHGNAGISQREMERKLAELAPQIQLVSEKARPIGNGKSELKLILDDSVMKQLEELKNLWGHRFPQAGYSEIVAAAIEDALKRVTRKLSGKLESEESTIAAAVKSPVPRPSPREIGIPASMLRKLIPAPVKRAVWKRAGWQCEFVATSGPFAGRRCTSRHALDMDHLLCVADGGTNELSNLQLRCKSHHRYKTKQEFPCFEIPTKTQVFRNE